MIAIVDYGTGNLRSVQKACEAVGGSATITGDPKTVLNADKIILPGVGAFRNAMRALCDSGLKSAICDSVQAGRKLLGICLGFQMLFQRSYEDGEFEGLGLLKGEIAPIRATGLKIPHMGWNNIVWHKSVSLNEGIPNDVSVYFVHSYAAAGCDRSDILATAEYGGEIVAAVQRGNVAGFQFHPEKSGDVGLKLLKNFVED